MPALIPIQRVVYTTSMLVALSLLVAACDNNELSTFDQFMGTWQVVEIDDDAGDRTPDLDEQGTLSARFNSDSTYAFTFVSRTDNDTTIRTGTYELDERQQSVLLTSDDLGLTFALEYTLQGTRSLTLRTSSDVVNPFFAAFGIQFTGTVVMRMREEN